MSAPGRSQGANCPEALRAEGSQMSAAGPSQGANCAAPGGSAAAPAASVGVVPCVGEGVAHLGMVA